MEGGVINIANKFFEDEKPAPEKTTGEPEKVKVGEQEFTSDELQDLIGAGQKLRDVETKQGQKFDDILKSWGKRGERIGEFKAKVSDYEKELDKYKNPPTTQEVDEEALRTQVLTELKKYGVPTLEEVKGTVEDIYKQNRAGEQVLTNVNKVLREAKRDGKPVVEPEELLKFMSKPANPKDPRVAYKVMLEKELDTWKEGQLKQAKKPTMLTQEGSTAGAKQPAMTIPTNKEDLRSALRIAIHGEEGGQ